MKQPSRIGYACINTTLSEQNIHVNRSMMKRTFLTKGSGYASTLALKNISDLEKVIDWNIRNRIRLYRMSSDMFPWMSEYELEDLPDIEAIKISLKRIGEKIKEYDHRITFHPGPFNVLASANDHVVNKTIKELRQHGEIMDLLGLPRSPFAKINIHIGGAYGDKTAAIGRFIKNTERLPPAARQRLTVENDDKASMFSVSDLLNIYDATGIPIVFDYLHHQFCMGDLTEEEAFSLAMTTWPREITPVVHYSSSRMVFEDVHAPPTAHADLIYGSVRCYNHTVDIMLEAKAKEIAVLKYRMSVGDHIDPPHLFAFDPTKRAS